MAGNAPVVFQKQSTFISVGLNATPARVTGHAGEVHDAFSPIAELHEYGERVFNLQRAILLREGWRAKESDQPEEFNFTDPVEKSPNNPQMIVPGLGEKSQSIKGNVLERDKFEHMRAEYYKIRGWDPDTGLQKTETLEKLKMGDIASELKTVGLVI